MGIRQVGSPTAASKSLSFTIAAPASLGAPTVYLSNPYPEAGLVYKGATLGTYWVEERATNWTTRNLTDLAACASVDGGCGTPDWALTALADGTPALEIGTPPDTAVIFLHKGVWFEPSARPARSPNRTASPSLTRSKQ